MFVNHQRRRCYANIPMNESTITNVATTQRCRRCTFDSPGLASESVVYPGLFAASGNNAVGVVPFILCRFIAAFHAEKAQHLRRRPPHYTYNPGYADANLRLSNVQRLQRWTTNTSQTTLNGCTICVILSFKIRHFMRWFASFHRVKCVTLRIHYGQMMFKKVVCHGVMLPIAARKEVIGSRL